MGRRHHHLRRDLFDLHQSPRLQTEAMTPRAGVIYGLVILMLVSNTLRAPCPVHDGTSWD